MFLWKRACYNSKQLLNNGKKEKEERRKEDGIFIPSKPYKNDFF